jgi:peptidoglycan/LPS O-acetylase OafA/YrhL
MRMHTNTNLDCLRAVAVTLVLIDHIGASVGVSSWGYMPLGYMGVFGVYLFFVHTSLVLMWSLERQPHVLNFYIRRAFRIYPLALAAMAVALVFQQPLISPFGLFTEHYVRPWLTIPWNLALMQNLATQPNVMAVMWSLPLEVQMYLVLPMLYFFASRVNKLWPLIVPTFIPDFIRGLIAYVAFRKFRPTVPGWLFAPFLLGLGAVYLRFCGQAASWPAMLALGLALPLFRELSVGWLNRSFHLIAKYSYGIYLAHSFMIVVVWHWMGQAGPVARVLMTVIATVAVAVACYHWLEEPMVRYGSRLAHANDRREARAGQLTAA